MWTGCPARETKDYKQTSPESDSAAGACLLFQGVGGQPAHSMLQ
jgi:hypothetical protein